MRKGIYMILFLSFVLAWPAMGENLIEPGEVLTLEKCIELALKNHPSIIASENTAKAAKSRVYEKTSGFWPQLSANASYSRTRPAETTDSSSVLSGLGGAGGSDQNKSYDAYGISLNLQQLIFDFGKTWDQTKIQDYNRQASDYQLQSTINEITFGVKQAYYGVLVAKRNMDVAQESVDSFQKHLDQAMGFYQVGTRAKFDVTKAEVDLSNAKLKLIQAQNSYRVAMVTLNNAMGLVEAPEYTLEDNLSYQKYEVGFEEALKQAYDNRPDLLALLSQEKAAKKSVELAGLGYLPTLTGNADYKWQGQEFPLADSWDVGAVLSWPLFNGFLTKNQVDENKYNLNVVKANQALLKQSILLEVRQAFLNLQAAEEGIPYAQLVVKQAQENLDLANGRYAAGIGNPVELSDAELAYSNAKYAESQALYNYKIAQASLEKAMGVK